MTKFSELCIDQSDEGFVGDHVPMKKLIGKKIFIEKYSIKPSKYPDSGNPNCLYLQIRMEDNDRCMSWTIAKGLMKVIQKIPESKFPIETTIVKRNDKYVFE